MKVIDSTTNLIDTAAGPVSVTVSKVTDFDIDDYVHLTVRNQALRLQVVQAAKNADPKLAKNRTPVNLDGIAVGGY